MRKYDVKFLIIIWFLSFGSFLVLNCKETTKNGMSAAYKKKNEEKKVKKIKGLNLKQVQKR